MEKNNIMIFSPARSGSTVLSLILGAHSRITNFGESHWLAEDTVSKQKKSMKIVCRAHGGDCEILKNYAFDDSRYANHFAKLSEICKTDYILTSNKTQGHYSLMDTDLLNNYSIVLYKPFEIWCGSYLSGNRKDLPKNDGEAIEVLANRYFKYFRRHEEFLKKSDFSKIYVMEYLRLVTEKADYVKLICDFLNIEFEGQMMSFNTYLASGDKDSHPIGGNVKTYGHLNKGIDGRYSDDENNLYVERKYLQYISKQKIQEIRNWDRVIELEERLGIKANSLLFE